MDKEHILNHGYDGIVYYNGFRAHIQKVQFFKPINEQDADASEKNKGSVYVHIIPPHGGVPIYVQIKYATYTDKDDFFSFCQM